MQYLDTRGQRESLQRQSFADILLSGMSPSGGLWSPEQTAPRTDWAFDSTPPIYEAGAVGAEGAEGSAGGGDFCLDAARITQPWTSGWADAAHLHTLFAAAWQSWAPHGPPLRQLDDDLWLMELFHGPSLSFKDFGLSFLARCFDEELQRQGRRGIVLVATSGDTGAAAVEALAGLEHVQLVVLLPEGRTSEAQRKQMTCALGAGVYPLLVRGTFDDCQRMVKHCLMRPELLPDGWQFLSVNSINFGRILAQQVYYHTAGAALQKQTGGPVSFAVPSGNFGNAYSAWLARSAGAPIDRILIGCNSNDGLHRFLQSGDFVRQPVLPTLSPAMDIALPSNLERLLFEAVGNSSDSLQSVGAGRQSAEDERVQLPAQQMRPLQQVFRSSTCNDECTAAQIRKIWLDTGIAIDPHTAVGVAAANDYLEAGGSGPVIVAATAHPCKFPDAMRAAGLPPVELPQRLQQRFAQPETYQHIEPSPEALAQMVVSLPG